MKRTKPGGFDGTTRDWKARKRRELRRLELAADVFNWGAIYTPTSAHILEIKHLIEEMKRACSARSWGR